MIYVKDRDLFWAHIPKSAGTSIGILLRELLNRHEIEYLDIRSDIRGPNGLSTKNSGIWTNWGAHVPRNQLHMWCSVPEKIWMVARDPWTRQLSYWQHHMSVKANMMQYPEMQHHAKRKLNTLTKWLKSPHSFTSMRQNITVWGTSRDNIIRWDHLEEDVNRMCGELGIGGSIKIPRMNERDDKSWSVVPIEEKNYWHENPECLEYISKLYAREIKEFGFKAPI